MHRVLSACLLFGHVLLSLSGRWLVKADKNTDRMIPESAVLMLKLDGFSYFEEKVNF
jgi:hypothetical protein